MAYKRRRKGEGSYGERTINGTKYKYYKIPNGKFIYAKTSKELDEKVSKYKEDQKEQEQYTKNSDGKLTIGEYSKYWLKGKITSIKPKTYDGYETIINIICKKELIFGDMQIKAIEKRQVQNFLDKMAKSYARNTITKTKALLNQIFDEAIEDGLIGVNPVHKTKVPIEENVVKDTKQITILDEDEIIKFKEEALRKYGNGKPVYGINSLISIFILNTGLRASEICGLRWNDVDLIKKDIYVTNNTVIIKNRDIDATLKNKKENGSPKTKKGYRHIPLTDEALNILNELHSTSGDNEYVFTTNTGTQIDISNLDRTVTNIVKKIGIEKNITPHSLRHTFASVLLNKGVDIAVVSKLLGHSKISTTYDIYIHILKNKDIEAINLLNN